MLRTLTALAGQLISREECRLNGSDLYQTKDHAVLVSVAEVRKFALRYALQNGSFIGDSVGRTLSALMPNLQWYCEPKLKCVKRQKPGTRSNSM